MRRKDREITDYSKMIEILKQCDCCRVAFTEENGPYILPLNFGFTKKDEQLVFYFHGSKEGKKMELIKNQKQVGFELDCKHQLVTGEIACDYSYLFQSIIGKGMIELVEDYDEKVTGLNVIMSQYSAQSHWDYQEQMVNSVAVIKLVVSEWTCKEH